MNKIFILLALIFNTELNFGQFNDRLGQLDGSVQLTGEDYITGEDGVPRMSVNVWGHVKYPGTYLVYDGIDILTCLSMAGGPLKGSNLAQVSIISKDGSSAKINLKNILDSNNISSINLKPHDTIYIDETFNHFIFSSSNVVTIFLQIAILIVNITK